jgi:hypothetical protein
MGEKKKVSFMLRDIPDDVHEMIVDEKAKTEKEKGCSCSNPRAIYQLIRRTKK